MKKILLLATILALPMVAFAQGRVNFANAGFAIQTNFTSVGGTVGNANRTFSPCGSVCSSDPTVQARTVSLWL